LKDASTLPAIEKLGNEDPNLRVRDAARRAAEAVRGAGSSP
jgi:hypothetical protein